MRKWKVIEKEKYAIWSCISQKILEVFVNDNATLDRRKDFDLAVGGPEFLSLLSS